MEVVAAFERPGNQPVQPLLAHIFHDNSYHKLVDEDGKRRQSHDLILQLQSCEVHIFSYLQTPDIRTSS